MANMETGFPDGAALVFGGSGGLGADICRLFAEKGMDVAFTYNRNQEAAGKIAATVEATGAKCHFASVNIEDAAAVSAYVEEALATLGDIHTVIFAAGAALELKALRDISPEKFAKTIDTDVNGFFNIAHASLPHLRGRGGGSIIALLTTAIKRNLEHDGLSAIPKACVQQVVQMLAREEGPANVRVNAVAPGAIDAGIVLSDFAADELAMSVLDAALDATPMGRMGKAEDISEAVVFLASSRAAYISGQTIHVDGGFSA
jgi:NAD(P)-dependent dehydrogenase (short-subunit alcohol dehydrogenase family)